MSAITVSAENCRAVTGMSWVWVRRFCAKHGVPMLQVATRKRVVAAADLLAAMQRVAAGKAPVSDADACAAFERALAQDVQNARHKRH